MLPDIQKTEPTIPIKINRVGISKLILPIFISQKIGGYQNTTAKIDCYVDLKADLKGINMSRIPRIIHTYVDRPLNMNILKEIAEDIRIASESEICDITYHFPYFVKKYAPSSGEGGYVHYSVIFNGVKSSDYYRFRLGVEVTTTNLCPCSKEISSYGAHNQRAKIKITVTQEEGKWIWLEDLIEIAESSSSCSIYSILKREDEKWVTEHAYINPMFVEDIARSCYDKLSKLKDISYFKVDVEAEESIHLHNARAIIESENHNNMKFY